MGTINYKTSDYITLGYYTNNIDYEEEFYSEDIQFEFDEIAALLEKESFYYFHITLEAGYYEGFSINIENDFPYCLDNYFEKLEAQKEITRIKKFLIHIVENFNVCACFPGWCTGWADYKKTIEAINAAAAEMRSEVKETPTYYKLKIAGEF